MRRLAMKLSLLSALLLAAPVVAEEVPAVGFPVPKPVAPPDVLTFSHQLHVGENGLECSECHEAVAGATTTAASLQPTMDVCEACHEDAVGETCTMCHSAGDEAEGGSLKSWVTEVKFSHAAHMAREKVECLTCHPDATKSTLSTDRLTPAMKTCEGCHQKQMDRLDCAGCHTDLASLKRSSSEVAVHKAGWFPMHSAWARGNVEVCSQCHQQTYCSECHEKTGMAKVADVLPASTDRTLVHRGDWIGRHALEAKSNPARCLSCHGTQVCQDCHAQEQGGHEGHASGGDFRRSPHPVGYLNRGNAAGFHGDEVRREAWRCASCHDQGAASNCVQCHKVGGPGGNPHPPEFERERGSGHEGERVSGTCAPCHL
ncbi:MAG: cytochrome c3 family protein [Deltaproteobacteria bacterium]|nr:cytochrome c3 family protein [Deltaproteobacteria bacterium]